MSFHLLCTLLYMRMRTIPRYCYRPHWRHSCESWWSTRRYLHEKVESTRLKSHGDYIYLIVYIWSLVYVKKQIKQVKVSSVSFTLHRTAFFFLFFFFLHESAFCPWETSESAHLNRVFLNPLRVCTNLGKKRFVIRVDVLCLNYYIIYHCKVFHLLCTRHYTSMCINPRYSGIRNWRHKNGNQWYIHLSLKGKITHCRD